jgi:4-hydroxy-tetrahydrodipicolinate synthase
MDALMGTGVALVTPFDSDGNVDVEGLRRLVNFQIDNGIDYLVVLGTTGEPATLSRDEKEMVKKVVRETNNGRLPMVLGIGGNNTQAVTDEIANTDLDDYAALLSVAPYYNRPSQEGIFRHFRQVAEASPIPLIVYNVPSRTGMNMLPETTLRLARECKNILAVKEAAGDIVQAMRLIAEKPEDFMVISGYDMLALPMVQAGGQGVISVIGQGLPADFSRMIQMGINGASREANRLQYKMMESIDLIFEEGNPVGIKALLNHLSICGTRVRLPLVEASYELRQKIGTFVQQYDN